MKRISRVLTGVGCFALLLGSWIVVIKSRSPAEQQLYLIGQADALLDDYIYIRAEPLLEEAAGINAVHKEDAEEKLKTVYLALIDKQGYRRKYIDLLELQMNRKNPPVEVFKEAADYYLSISKTSEAISALRDGVAKTGNAELFEKYERHRYAYETNRSDYDYVAAPFGPTIQVMTGGLWGIANADGTPLIPCRYEKISTFDGDRAVVMKDGDVYAIDRDNNRVAKLKEKAVDIGNFADDRIPVLIGGVWRRAFGDLTVGAVVFDHIGTYSGGYAAARTKSGWGVVNAADKWLVPAEFDGIVQDSLGRCYARNAVFLCKRGQVWLICGGTQTVEPFDDALPFTNAGYAAVKRDGKWGFADTDGSVVIDFIFEEALSFSMHLAAVKSGGLWGYVSLSGSIVIEPEFIEARSFSNGSAAVLTERGWQFITLIEYKKGPGL